MKSRFAAFWATTLVVLGSLLVALGILFAGVALFIDMPWGSLTGQAVLERTVAAIALLASGIFAGGPFIALGEMMRVFLDQRRLIAQIDRRLERLEEERAGDARRDYPTNVPS